MARYSSTRNVMVVGDDVTWHASAAQGSGTATSAAVPCTEYGSAVVSLTVSAVSGTNPTLDVTVQTASDSAFTTPVSVGTFTQVTGVQAVTRKVFTGLDAWVRLSSVVGGTATPTVTWFADGHVKP